MKFQTVWEREKKIPARVKSLRTPKSPHEILSTGVPSGRCGLPTLVHPRRGGQRLHGIMLLKMSKRLDKISTFRQYMKPLTHEIFIPCLINSYIFLPFLFHKKYAFYRRNNLLSRRFSFFLGLGKNPAYRKDISKKKSEET